jgi:Flp pilus assembly protein TadD
MTGAPHPAALLDEAHGHAAAGRDAQAIALYGAVLARDPAAADAANNLGVLLRRRGDEEGARRRYRHALAARPDHPDAGWNLGRALLDAGEADEAFLHLRRAAARQGGWDRWHMLGRACQARGDLAGAEDAYRTALRLRPGAPETLNNLANTLQAAGRPEAALGLLEQALRLDPEHADIRYNAALLLLLLGREPEGWREHEWRWRAPGFTSPRRSFAAPAWDGRPRPGATLLLHWEQGLGDTLQFVRFVAAARRRVGRTVLEVQPPLAGLLAGVEGADVVLPAGAPLPPFDLHAPLLSLPWLLGGATEGLPVPYLAAPHERTRAWAARLGASGLRVGVAWAGNPNHSNDRNRSLPLPLLEPLLRLPGISWFSLQVGARAADIAAAGLGDRITDLSGKLSLGYGETAAAIQNLDLVLSVDTSVAHLAGALGRRTWLLLPSAPDWRWGQAGPATRWYPTVRLWRQGVSGGWEDLVPRLAEGLVSLTLQYQA